MSRTNGTHDQGSAVVMAAECVFLSWVLYNVFLLSYVCSLRPNDLLHHLKEKGLKSSTFCTVIHGFRDSVVTLLRNRVNFFRHLGYLAHHRKTFLSSSLAHHPNSVAGFRLIRLLFCGDISPNPGPAPNCNKKLRSVCRRSVAHNHRVIQCDVCLCWCHIKCGKLTPAEYTKLAPFTVSFPWSCTACVISSKNLPFADIRNPSSDLDLSSDGDTSILNESSDNINIVHVQSTPSPNSSLSTCQLPAPPTHTKVSSGLKGMIINCNCLKGPSRFSKFQILLDFHKPNIILGCESKLDCEVPTYSFFPPIYSVFRKDRNRNGGGVFQAIKSEIVCEEMPNFGKDCEILGSSFKIGNCETLYLASCYNSPQDVLEEFSDFFNCVFESSNHHPNIIAAGDFNLGDIDRSSAVPFANNSVTPVGSTQ